MNATDVIKTRVSPDFKARVNEEAQRASLTESLWLRRVVDEALCNARPLEDVLNRSPVVELSGARGHHQRRREVAGTVGARLYVRVRHDDRLILWERANGRGMPAATYVGALLRAHLRALAPLPREELDALKRSIAELGSIGRNLNQIARFANQNGRITGPGRDDLRSMLKICGAMREHIKALVRGNVASWESGHAETGH